jgi:hypothetical protein
MEPFAPSAPPSRDPSYRSFKSAWSKRREANLRFVDERLQQTAVKKIPDEGGRRGWLCVVGGFFSLFASFGFLSAYVPWPFQIILMLRIAAAYIKESETNRLDTGSASSRPTTRPTPFPATRKVRSLGSSRCSSASCGFPVLCSVVCSIPLARHRCSTLALFSVSSPSA